MTTEHVIVPVDGSAVGNRAVAEGKLLADRIGATLHLFHAEPHFDRRETGMHRETQELAKRIGARAEIRPLGRDEIPPAEAIDRFAAELDNAAICMASHGRGRLLSSLMGSVTSDVVARGRPVIVVGPKAADEPAPIERVVACLDASAWSEQVLPHAVAWAQALEAPLWLVEVLDPSTDRGPAGGDLAESSYVHGVANELRASGMDLEWETLHDAHPAKAILRYVGDQPSTLVALATHGRSGLRQAVMGSVAGAVVHQARGPVLVLHPSG